MKKVLFILAFLPSLSFAAGDVTIRQGPGGGSVIIQSGSSPSGSSSGGGSSSLAVSQNGIIVSSPTAVINFIGATVALTGGATAQVTITGGSGTSIYNATSTAGLPYGANFSTITVNQTLTGNTTAVMIVSTGTGNALKIVGNGIPASGLQDKRGGIVNITRNSLSDGLVIYSSVTSPQSGSTMLALTNDNTGYNDPIMWIHNNGNSSNPFLRVDDGAPDLEIVNTSTANAIGLGKWEPFAMAYQGVDLQVNSRAYNNGTFENVAYWSPLSKGGGLTLSPVINGQDGNPSTSGSQYIQFFTTNAHTVGIKGPSATTASWNFMLPDTFSNGNKLMYQKTDGGNRQWAFTGTNMLYYSTGVVISTLTIPTLPSKGCLGTDANGMIIQGSCTGGGGASVNVSPNSVLFSTGGTTISGDTGFQYDNSVSSVTLNGDLKSYSVRTSTLVRGADYTSQFSTPWLKSDENSFGDFADININDSFNSYGYRLFNIYQYGTYGGSFGYTSSHPKGFYVMDQSGTQNSRWSIDGSLAVTNFQFSGILSPPLPKTIVSSQNISTGTFHTRANATSGAIVITLPQIKVISTPQVYRYIYSVCKVDSSSNTVTFSPGSGDSLDVSVPTLATQDECTILISSATSLSSDGGRWFSTMYSKPNAPSSGGGSSSTTVSVAYGSIYTLGGSVQQTGIGTTPVKLAVFTSNGDASGTTPDHSNDQITVSTTAAYSVFFNVVSTGVGVSDQKFWVAVNGSTKPISCTDTPSVRCVGSGVLALTANDVVTVYANSTVAGTTITVQSAQLSVHTVGGTTGGGTSSGGSSSLEVFSNFDGTSSSSTASISIGDSMKLTVSGSTASLNVDFSSAASLGNNVFTGAQNFTSAKPSTFTYGVSFGSITLQNQGNTRAVYMNGSQLATSSVYTFNGSTVQATHLNATGLVSGSTYNVRGKIVFSDGTEQTTAPTGGGSIAVSTGGYSVAASTSLNFVSGNGVSVTGANAGNTVALTFTQKYSEVFNARKAKVTGNSDSCDISNSTSATTASILCDDSTNESATWETVLQNYNGGTLGATIYYTMSSATSGNVVHNISVMCVTPGDAADLDTPSFDTANSVTASVPGTAGYLTSAYVTITNNDSCAFGDVAIWKYTRNASSGSDTATGDIEVRSVAIREN